MARAAVAGQGPSKLRINKPLPYKDHEKKTYTTRGPFLYQPFRNFLEQFE